MRKMHGERGAALRAAAQIRGVTEHLRERHFHSNDIAARAVFRALNRRTPRIQVAEHLRHVLFWNHDFHFHDRFQKNRRGSVAGFLERHRAGDLERHFRAVHVVRTAVDQNRGDVHHRETRQDAVIQSFANARFDRRDELARNRTADDLVDEQEAVLFVELPLSRRAAHDLLGQSVQIVRGQFFHVLVAGAGERVQLNFAMPVLAASAGLLDVFAFRGGLLANGFAVRHLGTPHVGLHVIFAQHAVHDNFQVQFAHAGDQRLPGIRFRGNTERGIFLRQPLHRHTQFVLVGFRLRLDGHGNNRCGEIDIFENDRLAFVAERVAGIDALQTNAGADIARINLVNLFALVRVHLQQTADALARALAGVQYVTPGLQHAGIHADVRHMPDEWVRHDFERQGRKGLIVPGQAQLAFVILRVHALQWSDIHRGRQIIDNGIEQRLNPLVLERGACQHRHDFQRQRRFTDRLAHLLHGQRHFVQILVDHFIVVLGDVLNDFLAMVVVKLLVDRRTFQSTSNIRPRIHERLVPQLLDRKSFELRSQRFFQPNNDFFLEEIDDADEIIFTAKGKLQRYGVGSQALAYGANHVVKIRSHAVHLVHKTDAWNAVFVRLAPYGFRLRLHAGDGIEYAHRAVQNAQRALHFHREVHVAGRINNIDAVLLIEAIPGSGRRRARNGNPTLALLLHPVHGGRAFIHRTDLVGHTRIEQDALRRRRFSGVDVRHDPDVARVFEFEYPGHNLFLKIL